MGKNKTEITLSQEAKIVNVVMPDANMEPAGRVNYFHRVTKEAGKLSIAAAFYAGLELMKVKAGIPHGDFSRWIDSNCSFGAKTAQNYIHVAYMCLNKAGYDCDELLEGTDTDRVKAIEDATERCESDSLNEIYIDLGICQKSKSKMGGRREGAGRPRKDSQEELAAAAEEIAAKAGVELVKQLLGDLYVECVSKDGFGAFPTGEIKAAAKMLEMIVKRANEIVKSRKDK